MEMLIDYMNNERTGNITISCGQKQTKADYDICLCENIWIFFIALDYCTVHKQQCYFGIQELTK